VLMLPLNYPVTATFSILSIGQTVRITDALGTLILYVKQKAFRLKTDVVVFADEAQTQPVYRIRGDRMMGSVKYAVSTADGPKWFPLLSFHSESFFLGLGVPRIRPGREDIRVRRRRSREWFSRHASPAPPSAFSGPLLEHARDGDARKDFAPIPKDLLRRPSPPAVHALLTATVCRSADISSLRVEEEMERDGTRADRMA